MANAKSGQPFPRWLEDVREIGHTRFALEVGDVVVAWVAMCFRAGWQPTELIRHMRLKGSAGLAGLTRYAVAAERAGRTGVTQRDPRWLRQWEASDLPAGVPAAGWALRWATDHAPDDWLEFLHRWAGMMLRLPSLDLLLPVQEGERVIEPLATRDTGAGSDPTLTRVRALLAKAESTEHESEAFAFTAKAQELMTKHAIDMAMLQAHEPRPDAPQVLRLPVDPPYAESKAFLLHTVALHSRCRMVFHASASLCTVIGYATDLEAVEVLFTSLLVQAQSGLTESTAQAPPGSRRRSPRYRAAFLQGFATRVGERLAEVNHRAYAGEHSGAFLPVLRARDERIEEFMSEHFPFIFSKPARGGYDPEGYFRGRQAGDAAGLSSGVVSRGAA